MLRVLWGVLLVVVGALFALQTFGVLAVSLPFWPIVLTIFGLYLVVRSLFPSPFRLRPGPAWLKLSLGLWLAGIGIADILHVNEITAWTGRNVWSVGWFILLIGAGLALIFGGNRSIINGSNGRKSHGWGRYRHGWNWFFWPNSDSYRHALGVGDLHYGREPWVLDRKLTIRQRAGDIRIDLTSAQMDDGSHDLDVAAAVGEVVILVPEQCNANVRARVSTGSIDVFGERRDGMGAVGLEKSVTHPEATVTLNIVARLRVGEVSVRRVPTRNRED